MKSRLVSGALLATLVGLASAAPALGAGPPSVGTNIHSLVRDMPPGTANDQQVADDFAAIADLGFDVVRIDVPWAHFEPTDVPPGQSEGYSANLKMRLDHVQNLAEEKDVELVFVVQGTPGWADSCPRVLGNCLDPKPWMFPPVDANDYGEFIGFLTDTYHQQLRGIEVWNEANWGTTSAIRGSAPQWHHAQMIIAADQHATNGVEIYAGALHPGPDDPVEQGLYPDKIWDAWMGAILPNIDGHFDVWSVHDYGSTPTFVADQHALLDGFEPVDVSVTEFGGEAHTQEADRIALSAKIRNYLVQLGGPPYSSYVDEAIQYELRDTQGQGFFGLMWEDFSRKQPTYDDLRTCLAADTC